jgi:hypothetical protein
MPLTPSQYLELTEPFRLKEHGLKPQKDGDEGGNPYLLKTALQKRLYRVAPGWEMSEPKLVTLQGDVVVMSGSLTIEGQTHGALGIGTIRHSTNGNAGVEAQLLSTAFKTASSDILPRCALLFGIGWYLKVIPAGWKKRVNTWEGLEAYLTEVRKVWEESQADIERAKTKLGMNETRPERRIGGEEKKVDPATGEIQQPPPDTFARNFPATAATAFVPDKLYAETKDVFNARTHFDNFLKKHADALQGKTQDEAVAYVRNQHWNWSTDRVTAFAAYGKTTFGMTNAEILEALTAIAGHELKRFRDWDRGPEMTARAALLAWQGGYVPSNIRELGTEKHMTSDEIGEAVLLCEVYDQQREHA